MHPIPGRALAGGLLALPLVLSGCQSSPEITTPETPPFVFRSLDLRQKKADGQRDWDLTSPEARYNVRQRLVRARNPAGLLYRNNRPAFSIRAQSAMVFNDGELVILEGQVQLQQLQGQKVLIRGDRLRWTPGQSLLVMEQRPQADDASSRIRSTTAQLRQDTQQLTLKGVVQLEQWTGKVNKQAVPTTVIRTGVADWNLGDGALKARGPVLGQRRDDHNTLQQLQASRLTGNTQKGFIDLIEPVQVRIPKRQGVLEALTTRWNFQKETLTSSEPFRARMEQSSLSGQNFRVNLKDTTVLVTGGCRLKQPGDQLDAERCLWNWSDDAVLAEGQVVLRRQANDQITRSQRLEGKVGKKGLVVFSAPGDKVRSQLSLEEGRPGPQKKRKPAPVSF